MDGEIGTTVAPLRATWTRLRVGGWGLRIDGAARTGDTVIAARRDGSTEPHVVGRIVWTDGTATIATSAGAVVATVEPGEPDPATEGAFGGVVVGSPVADRARFRRTARSNRKAYRAPSSRGRCEDAPCCGCCDTGGRWSF